MEQVIKSVSQINTCFCMYLYGFPFFFLYFVSLVMEKVVLASKKLISTSGRHAKHPFNGKNTKQ